MVLQRSSVNEIWLKESCEREIKDENLSYHLDIWTLCMIATLINNEK